MSPPAARDPVLDAILAAAAAATQATRGWLLALTGDQVEVVATAGTAPESRLGARGPRQFGWAGYVLAAGQPVAIVPRADDPRFLGDLVADPLRRPASLACFPCRFDGEPVGALQLEDKAGGTPFVLDDVELAGYLGDVAGAALASSIRAGGTGAGVPAPGELAVRLAGMATANPNRFRAIAGVVEELLNGP